MPGGVDSAAVADKRRQGGTRGGKNLRRRKDAISRQSQSPDGAAGTDGEFVSAASACALAGGAGAGEGVEAAVLRIGRLTVQTDKVLGHGSQGTIVYSGQLDDGRQVAIKRLLAAFVDVAKVGGWEGASERGEGRGCDASELKRASMRGVSNGRVTRLGECGLG